MFWLIGILLGGVALLALGALAQPLARRRDDRRYPPPGRLYPIAPAEYLHAMLAGDNGPGVVLDAALGATSLSWARVQPEAARFARVLSYDRLGFGYSSPALSPRSLDALAGELQALLRQVSLPSPYILVGHSYGGLVIRRFAQLYPGLVAGLVLVDAAAPEQWVRPTPFDLRRLRIGARLARRGAWAARLGLARTVAWMVEHGAGRLARASAVTVSGGALRARADLLLAPALRLSPELRPYLRRNWLQPAYYSALAGMMECLPTSAAGLLASPSPGDIPIAILIAADADPARADEQRACARLSSRFRCWTARSSGHWIPIDDPELVIEAIRWVIANE